MSTPQHEQVMRSRQVFVTVAAVFCVLGTLVGTGVIGTRVAESAGGDLAADATMIAPAGPAFSIWSVIYLGLLAYTARQWFTPYADTRRHAVTAGLAAISMILNATWLLVTQVGWLEVSVVVIAALVYVCGLMVVRLQERPAPGLAERIVVDGTFGLYLGWVCVAICANVAATGVARGLPGRGTLAAAMTVVVLAVVVGIAAWLARELRGNWFVAAGIAWGLAWISVGRLGDEPHSIVVGVAAALAAAAVLALTWRASTALAQAEGSEPDGPDERGAASAPGDPTAR